MRITFPKRNNIITTDSIYTETKGKTIPTIMESSATEPTAAAKRNGHTVDMKQLQRYYSVLRDFMSFLHGKDDTYPANHEFTQDELSAVTPSDIVRFMTMKLYNKEDPGLTEKPVNGSHHTIDYYKKSISYFMPQKETSWNTVTQQGNPTRSSEVNNFIKRIRSLDDSGGTKKRKSSLGATAATDGSTKSPIPLKKAKAPKLPPGLITGASSTAAAASPTYDTSKMEDILCRMHSQNASFIDLFSTLSQSLDKFKVALQSNNQAILNEIASMKNMPGSSSSMSILGSGNAAAAASDSVTVDNSSLDWMYVHDDGVRRRAPPSWTFPSCNMQELYIQWHCGDYQNRISPMKLFSNADVSFLGKRARMNLGEVKRLCKVIDEEAQRKGKTILSTTMNVNQALECFKAGVSGFSNFQTTTPKGRDRDIMRLKWSSMAKYANEGKREDDIAIAAKTASEFVPDPNDMIPDNWWYQHDDGVKRRVPSSWKFPLLGLTEMYIYWHCGDAAQKISPMKLMQTRDLPPDMKRAKTNLSEVRSVMVLVDQEATRQGLEIKSIMTPLEALDRVRVGYPGLGIIAKTPDGRDRDILSMKWSSCVRFKGGRVPSPKKQKQETTTGETSAEPMEVAEAELEETSADV